MMKVQGIELAYSNSSKDSAPQIAAASLAVNQMNHTPLFLSKFSLKMVVVVREKRRGIDPNGFGPPQAHH